MKRSIVFVLLLMLSVPMLACASGTPVEASMVITGTITVNPDGSVRGYALDKENALPPYVLQIVQKTVPHWEFMPIKTDGKAVTAKTGMSLRIVADMTDAKHATIRVAGAEFGCDAYASRSLPGECPPGAEVLPGKRTPPEYPVEAERMGVSGEVFLVLQVGRDGRVTQAAVRQVNLYRLTDDRAPLRRELAYASLKAARNWRFKVPTVGPEAAKQHWIVQVPVNYTLRGSKSPGYGAWRAYVPGPVQVIPWSDDDATKASHGSADAVARDATFVKDNRFVLKTQFTESTGRS